jgi:hypothetical protein
MAYPRQVERIQRETRAPNRASAAATLLEQLIRPGFDPAQGAEATRRYVRRKSSIAVMQHRKREAPDRYPWTQVGISERRYYKLLPQFAQKVNGRYVLDHDDVVARMKAYLDRVDHVRAVRTAALDVLRAHGFGEEAARKWLQRHRPEEAVDAWPRSPRPYYQLWTEASFTDLAPRKSGRTLIGTMARTRQAPAAFRRPGRGHTLLPREVPGGLQRGVAANRSRHDRMFQAGPTVDDYPDDIELSAVALGF